MSRIEKEGVCPNCEEKDTFEYGTMNLENDGVDFPVVCMSCHWEGSEYYTLKFDGFKI